MTGAVRPRLPLLLLQGRDPEIVVEASLSQPPMERVPGGVSGFDLLRDGPVNALVIDADALLALLRLGHGLHEASSALAGMLAASSGLAVLDDMSALRAVRIVAVLLEVLCIDTHVSGQFSVRRPRPSAARPWRRR